ncbi:glycosyltransferase family 2 protein [Thioalkalivibrio sp. AKL10]|uniref:glycosyltransferase family 2 protein n=1 Tax=Thioalkalivibrio sp. AKL10 TaxID=1158158 RepID=UPI00037B7F3E|nr:glycosyltransferase [Thioalkalivibrio sp. AKL10]
MISGGEILCSVIIPVYRHWDDLNRALSALERQTLERDAFEVIVVDNDNDNDPGQGPAISGTSLNVRVVSCDAPGSYAARNAGIEHARGAIVAFTDADCQPDADWLRQGLSAMENRAFGLVAGPVLLEPALPGRPGVAEHYDMLMGIRQERYVRRGYAATANLFVRRALFDVVGVFDSHRYSGGDAEFCRRAGAAGFRIGYAQAVLVRHPARATAGALVSKARRLKGGQVTRGPLRHRVFWVVRTFLPPVLRCARLMLSRTAPAGLGRRFDLCRLQLYLWWCEVGEVRRLLGGGEPLRG